MATNDPRDGDKTNSKSKDATSTVADEAKDFIGAGEWKRSKISYLTGAGIVREGISSFTTTIGGAKSRVGTLFTFAFRRETGGVSVDQSIEDSRERFREAMRVNRRSLSDVNKSVETTFKQFWAYIGAGVLVFLISSISSLNSNNNFGFFTILIALLGPISLAGALALRAGYTNWMFRRRRLDSLTSYLNSGELLPKHAPPMPKIMGGKSVVPTKPNNNSKLQSFCLIVCATLLAILALTTFETDEALAQSTSSASNLSVGTITATPSSTDVFIQLMSIVVPGVGPVPQSTFTTSNSAATATMTALGSFCALLLLVGTATTAYQIIVGIVASAKEGTALGRQYHEVWAPIRMVVGFGFLTPMINGLCAAQVLVIYLIVWGGNMANVVWSNYTSTLTSMYSGDTTEQTNAQNAQSAIGSAAANAQALVVVRNLAQDSLCLGVLNAVAQNRNLTNAVAQQPTLTAGTASGNITPYTLNFTSPAFGGGCGQISINVSNGQAPPQGALSSIFGSTVSAIEAQNQSVMDNANKQGITDSFNNIWSWAQTAAQTYVASGGTGSSSGKAFVTTTNSSPSQLTQAISTYAQDLITAANTVQSNASSNNSSSMSSLQTQLASNGWAAAGSYYLTIGRLQNSLYTGLDQSITNNPSSLAGSSNIDTTVATIIGGNTNSTGLTAQFNQWWDTVVMPAVQTSASSTGTAPPTLSASAAAKMVTSNSWTSIGIISPFFLWLPNAFSQTSGNPFSAMQQMIDFGNTLEEDGIATWFIGSLIHGAAEGGLLGSMAGYGCAGIASLLPAGGAAANTGCGIAAGVLAGPAKGIASLMQALVIGVIAAGILHSWVLPMIPYMQTVFFVAGMLVLVVESLVAAPLWAFFHIRMDGQEFVDQVQRPGYMIAFNLLLRPSMMIFGLMLSYLVFGAMIFFVSQTFQVAAASMAGSQTVGPIGAVVLVILVTYLHYQVAVRSFHLITQVPDRVTRWFGAGGENLGEDSQSRESTAFISGRVEGAAQNSMSIMAARGGGRGIGKGPTDPKAVLAAAGGGDSSSGGGGGGGGKGNSPKPGASITGPSEEAAAEQK